MANEVHCPVTSWRPRPVQFAATTTAATPEPQSELNSDYLGMKRYTQKHTHSPIVTRTLMHHLIFRCLWEL